MATNHSFTADSSSIRIAPYPLDRLVAPDLASLQNPVVPDLKVDPPRFDAWFLNNLLVGSIAQDDLRILMSVLITRAENARAAYENGREKLDKYVSSLKQTNRGFNNYRAAVREFEVSVLHCHLANIAKSAVDVALGQPRAFVTGDGSIADRVRLINNRIKHFDEDLAKGQIDRVVPVWLTNGGIECRDVTVTYAEFAAAIDDVSNDANFLCETMFQKLIEHRTSKSGVKSS